MANRDTDTIEREKVEDFATDGVKPTEGVRQTPPGLRRAEIEGHAYKGHERAWALIYPGESGTLETTPDLPKYARQLIDQGHNIDFIIADTIFEQNLHSIYRISTEGIQEIVNGTSRRATSMLKTNLESRLRDVGATTANFQVGIMSDLEDQPEYSDLYKALKGSDILQERIKSYLSPETNGNLQTRCDIEITKLAFALTRLKSHAYWISFDSKDDFTLTLLREEQECLESILDEELPELDITKEKGYKIITLSDHESPSDRLNQVRGEPINLTTAPTVPSATDENQPKFVYIMQETNLFELVRYAARILKERGINIEEGKILDPGHGDGLLTILAPKLNEILPVFMGSKIYGVDKKDRKVKSARENYKREKEAFKKLGITLPETSYERRDIVKGIRNRGYNLIVCNQVLHWVENGDRQLAIKNLYGSLAPGGVLIMSTAADGTAPEFLEAYKRTLIEIGEHRQDSNPNGFKQKAVRKRFKYDGEEVWDPIGCIPMEQLEEYFSNSGFRLKDLSIIQQAEPTVFEKGASQYAEAVKSYGFEEFMAPLPKDPELREEVWKQITDRFVDILKKKRGYVPGEPYTHRQITNYVVACKPEVHTSK